VRAAGAEVVSYGIAPDRIDLLRGIINEAQRDCDLLITTGGVSMGELDLMKGLAAELGEVHFGRLLMKPGKPCTFATLPRIVGVNKDIGSGAPLLYFGLPGKPVSALVTFYLLALPAIRKMAGSPAPNLARVQATLAESHRIDATRTEYHRATLTWEATLHNNAGGWRAASTGSQASSRLASFQRANALLVLPPGAGSLAPGDLVDALLLPGGLEAMP
jgi:gephyrin